MDIGHLTARALLHDTDLAPDDLFLQTRHQFLATLTDQDRAQFSQCASVEELLADIEKFDGFTKSKRRTAVGLAKVKAFGDKLEPYFKVLEIVCATHPEWANVALGALRLILQLASHFTTFFEKLCSVVESVSAKLPRYAELYERLVSYDKAPTPRLRLSLQKTYVGLFEFFQSVARVFSNSRGRPRTTPIVVADLMWKPFDLRFRNVLETISFHQSIIVEELSFSNMERIQDDIQALKGVQSDLATVRAQNEMFKLLQLLVDKYDHEMSERFCSSVIRWIDSPDFKENFFDARDERTEGTAEWIYEDSRFVSWRNRLRLHNQQTECPNSLLWINGNPGSGKTILASSIVEELIRVEKVANLTSCVCYYFFGENTGKKITRIDAYRAIAAQIFHKCHKVNEIHDIFAWATIQIATDTRASEQELVDLIRECLNCIPDSYLILDAIDECADGRKILRDITNWCRTSPVRIIVLTRPDVTVLRKLMEPHRIITLSQDLVADDISRYLVQEIEEMQNQELLPETADISTLVRRLVERSEGMFLWARVMIAYLYSPALARRQRMETIMEQTPGDLDRLEDLYCRIQDRIDFLDKPSKELAHKALMWVSYAQVSLSELKEAIFPEGWDVDSDDGFQQFEHAVIVSCRGFIEKKNNGVFKYIHLTARDFAREGLQRQGQRVPMVPKEPVAKALMASRCVSYLTEKLPGKPLSGQLGVSAGPEALTRQWPFLRYASWNWLDLAIDALEELIEDTLAITEMVTLINGYLNRGLCLMAWIEALYTLKYNGLSDKLSAVKSVSEYRASCESRAPAASLLSDICEMIADMCRLDSEWNEILVATPCEIWGDITMFVKSRFLIQTKAGSLETLVPVVDLEDKQTGVKPLFGISRSTTDGKRLATLSVFPCSFFRNGWAASADIPYYPERFDARRKEYDEKEEKKTEEDLPFAPIAPRTRNDIKDACSGWIATYEIFSVMDAGSESILLITIPLDAADIELCLRQGLRHSITVFENDKTAWLCSFPLSIGPRLNMFTILNKLVCLDSNGSQYAVNVPISFRTRYDMLWTTRRPFWINFQGFARQYTYNFTWSPDGKFLAFFDFECQGVVKTYKGSVLAIFSITFNKNDPILTFLNSFYSSSLSRGIHSCNFHPSHDILVFQDEDETYLWQFIDQGREPQTVSSLDITNIRIIPYRCQVSFSHCGRFLAVYYLGEAWPEMIPLEKCLGSEASAKRKYGISGGKGPSKKRRRVYSKFGEDWESKDSSSEDEDSSVMVDVEIQAPRSAMDLSISKSASASTSYNITKVLAPPITSIASSAIVVTGGSKGNLTLCNVTSNEVQIHSKSGSEEMVTPLVKLPHVIPTGGLSVQVAAPAEGDDPALYKIVLNASPLKNQISSRASPSDYLPIVVRKDARALRPAITPASVERLCVSTAPHGKEELEDVPMSDV